LQRDIAFIRKEEELLDKIVHIVAETLKAEACSVLIYDETSDRLKIISHHGMPELLKDTEGEEYYKENEGLTGKIFSSGKTLKTLNISYMEVCRAICKIFKIWRL
jgi:signal transduction protein with GAF and PtsI domain